MKNIIELLSHHHIAILMILSGLALRLIIGQRQFSRRSSAGLQRFSNFYIAIIVLLLEWLIGIAGKVLILAGLLYLFITI